MRPDERPETWFSDIDFSVSSDISLVPMGRVINVEGLNGIPVGNGTITLAIDDSHCPWNTGIFRFTGQDGYLSVSKLDDATTVDARLTIQGLSALVYGTHATEDFQWRGWGTLRGKTADTLSMLFPLQAPYLFTMF